MSSLYKPFSVSEGPCKDAISRRGCTTQPEHPLTRIPSAQCFGAGGACSTGTFTPIPNIYPGQRNLAAAAIGGRKITHPWKAILAGKCLAGLAFVFWWVMRHPIMPERTTTVMRVAVDHMSRAQCTQLRARPLPYDSNSFLGQSVRALNTHLHTNTC